MPEKDLKKIVVLGTGNLLCRDEGVGIRVIEELGKRFCFPPEVELVDGGVLGLGLLPVIEGAGDLIIIDAVINNREPGTIYRFVDGEIPERVYQKISMHELDLLEALTIAREIGPRTPRKIVLGVEPLDISPWGMELTPVIEARVNDLVDLVLAELRRLGIEYQPG